MNGEQKLERAYNLMCEVEDSEDFKELSNQQQVNLVASRSNLETIINVERD